MRSERKPPSSERRDARYNSPMSDSERSVALTTACDDLQAQLEAGDRSLRHLDHDLTLLREALRTATSQTHSLTDLYRHLAELRGNMREQRTALREVRRAATRLCATMAQTRDRMELLTDEQRALEQTQAALLAELSTPRNPADHDTESGPPLGGRRSTKDRPAGATSDRDPNA